MNHNPISQANLDRVSAANSHSDNAGPGHRSDENEQTGESLMQTLSLLCDDVLAAEKQDAAKAASECISIETEKDDLEEEVIGQDIREQSEGGAESADGAWEEQETERETSIYVNGTQSIAHNSSGGLGIRANDLLLFELLSEDLESHPVSELATDVGRVLGKVWLAPFLLGRLAVAGTGGTAVARLPLSTPAYSPC
ncbi:MAG: hypothetical protein Q9195_008839 [Heterodermia aff. obscurata]